jgi:hypothetical protein
VALKDLQNLILNGAIISGGVSIVARVQAWRRFKAALAKAHTLDAGDRLYQRDWDFRYWHGVGLRTAELSIFCSILWLFSKLLYL